MNNFRRSTFYLVTLLGLLAASMAASAARPRAATADEAKYFSLDQEVVVHKLRPAKNITLSKCVYRLTFIDESGEYFTGEDGCFRLVNWQGDGKSQNGQGGIWIPKNPQKSPRAYMVVGTDAEACAKMGVLICQLSKLENGRFRFMPGKAEHEAVVQMKVVIGSP